MLTNLPNTFQCFFFKLFPFIVRQEYVILFLNLNLPVIKFLSYFSCMYVFIESIYKNGYLLLLFKYWLFILLFVWCLVFCEPLDVPAFVENCSSMIDGIVVVNKVNVIFVDVVVVITAATCILFLNAIIASIRLHDFYAFFF